MNKRKFQARAMLICLFLLLFAFTIKYTYSEYKSDATGTSSRNVAKFVLKDTARESLGIDIHEIDPDNPCHYSFYISNYDAKGRNDVSLNYKIKVSNNYQNLPLIITLTKKDDSSNLLDEENSYSGKLGFIENEKHEFVLTIAIPKDAYLYQDIIDEVILEIEAVQVN